MKHKFEHLCSMCVLNLLIITPITMLYLSQKAISPSFQAPRDMVMPPVSLNCLWQKRLIHTKTLTAKEETYLIVY